MSQCQANISKQKQNKNKKKAAKTTRKIRFDTKKIQEKKQTVPGLLQNKQKIYICI